MGRIHHSNKETFWLRWDGSISDDGRLNTADVARVGVALTRPARKTEAGTQKTAKKTLKTLIRNTSNNPLMVPIHISVRVLKLDIAGTDVRIPIQLKNYTQVRGLLLRVYDKAGVVIYHEYIDLPLGPAGVLAVANALEKATATTAPLSPPLVPALPIAAPPAPGFASTGHSLCRVEVWATRTAAVLSNKAATDKLGADFNVYLQTVSSSYEPTARDIASKRRRYGDVWRGTGRKLYGYLSSRANYTATQLLIANHAHQSSLDRAQKVIDGVYAPRTVQLGNGKPCLRIVLDKRATSNTQNFAVAARIADIRAQIQEAEDALEEEEIRTTPDHEVRLFIASEWHFRKSNNANVATNAGVPSYTHAEFLAIVQDLKALSLAFPHWLIIPGTIYWTLQFATRLHTWGAVDMAALQNDIIASFAVPLLNGNNGVARAAVIGPPKTCFNANVALFLSGGDVIHYQYKQHAGEAEWQGHEFLTSFYLWQEHHTAVFQPSYFAFRGLLFGVDICRDHYEHRCFYERSGQLAAIRTSYLNQYAAALVDVTNAVAGMAVSALLPVLRGYVASLLGIRVSNTVPAVPGLAEANLIGRALLPVAGPTPAGMVNILAAVGVVLNQVTFDQVAHPGIQFRVGSGGIAAQHGPLSLLGAGAPTASVDAMVNDFTERACSALKQEEDKVAAMAPHVLQATNLLTVTMAPCLLTPALTGAGVITIGGLALNPAGALIGDLDAMLIVSNGTPNRQYGALNVAQGGVLAQCDGAVSTDCSVEQIQVVNPGLPALPANTRAQCALNMAAGGRALAKYDIVAMMFDFNRSQRQAALDAGNLVLATQHFEFERDCLSPLFIQLTAARKALTDQLNEHMPRVTTKITVPAQAQTAVAPSSRYDDANIDTLVPPTGRGGTLLGRIL